jgi:serine/threonine-protein kinase
VDSESDDPGAKSTETDEILLGSTLLGSYKVERVLGEGGMGRIYEAQHTRIAEKRFAIKVLRPELITSSQVRARFQREIEAVARVTHPAVLSIIDVGSTDRGWPFMVCEYLHGMDLLRYLRRFGPLQDDRVVQVGCRIAEALEATHAQGVIHRDLKPSNVFLLGAFEPLGPEWDRVKLIDFGLSRFVSRDDQLSKSGVVMGTPAYMSPEQARGSKTDHLTDVYGVGAVLYAAATGVPPFREETQQQTLIAVMSREPVRPREINPAISEQLELVIQRAMSKQPEKRQPSMSALRLELSNLEQRTSARVPGGASGAGVVGVRWRFLGLAASALLRGAAALASAALGTLALNADVLRLDTNQQAALALGLGTAAGLFMLAALRFQRRTWRDTAQVADWLPRLRVPVITGLVLYGLASFGVRLGDDVLAHLPANGSLARAPRVAWPGWSILLAALALFGGTAAALHQNWWRALRTPQRWAWALGLSATLALGALAFVRFGPVRHDGDGSALAGAVSAAGSDRLADISAGTAPRTPSQDPPVAEPAPAPLPTVADAGADAAALRDTTETARATDDASLAQPAHDPAPAQPAKPIAREVSALTPHAQEHVPSPAPTPPAPEPPSSSGSAAAPSRAEVALPSAFDNPARLADAVENVARLLAQSPARASDPQLQQLLRRAASSDGEASRAAFRVMGEAMGSRGPDLIWDLMVEKPELAQKAKFRLTRFKVKRLFSPQLSIAFDLRFFETCAGRISLLPRANALGDQRSLNVLASLATVPESCAGKTGPACTPRCPREAAAFLRSMEIIDQRIRGGQRAALAN